MGRAIRAVAQDKEGSSFTGSRCQSNQCAHIRHRLRLAATAGRTGRTHFCCQPFLGNEVILKAFLVCDSSGMGSVPGALLGGLVLGFIERLWMPLLHSANRDGAHIHPYYCHPDRETPGASWPWIGKLYYNTGSAPQSCSCLQGFRSSQRNLICSTFLCLSV